MPAQDSVSTPRALRPRRDISKTSGGYSHRDASPHTTNSVQDRILQWQAQGVAALPPDALSARSAPRSASQRSPPGSRSETPTDSPESPSKNTIRSTRGRKARRLVEAEQEEWIRRGRASTPKKRVVSDEHWMRSRTISANQDGPPRSILLSNEDLSPNADAAKELAQAKHEREERRRRRVAARTKASELFTEHDSAARNAKIEKEQPTVDIQSNVGHRTGYDSEREELSDGSDNWGSLPDRDHENMLINSRYAATLGRPLEYPPRSSLRVKGKMLSKTKAMLGINEVVHEDPDFVTSIGAWLEEQPELFTEAPQPIQSLKRTTGRRSHREKGRSSRQKHLIEHQEQAMKDIESLLRSNNDSSETHGHYHDVAPSNVSVDASALTTSLLRPDTGAATTTKRRRYTVSQTMSSGGTRDKTHPSQDARSKLPPVYSDDKERSATTSKQAVGQDLLLLPPSTPQKHTNIDANDGACTLKRRLTTHEDLISELSKPGRSRRVHRKRTSKPVQDQGEKQALERILSSMKEDNVRYVRELRTMVDGVIPVLLQCVLSKNDAVARAVLFSVTSDTTNDQNITKPIVDMGVALERLKTLHNRMSCNDVDRFLSWCQTAHRAYSDYLQAWRLGFQDIIVNLAPLENESDTGDLMARDKNGDILDADGEKADVAYLLKRPLIKIRKLSKTLAELANMLKEHVIAQRISEDYVELTAQAKRKHQQEQGRLEDDAAAQVDATKTRDIRSLGTLPGAVVERGYKVRARDMFNLTLQHSTGQRIDCKVELILRDNVDGRTAGGDVLICQVEASGKWLLFAPVLLTNISARRDESEHDLVIMIRGRAGLNTEWHELLALQAEEKGAITDWMNMLGSNPLPPRLNIKSNSLHFKQPEPQIDETQPLTSAALAQMSSADDVDIPLGEPSIVGTQPVSPELLKPVEKSVPKLSLGGGLQQKSLPQRWLQQSLEPQRKPDGPEIVQVPVGKVSENHRVLHLPKQRRVQSEVVIQSSQPSPVAQQQHHMQPSVVGTTVLSDSSSNVTSSTNYHSTSSATSIATSQPSARKVKHVSLALPEVQTPTRHDHRRSVSTAVGKRDTALPRGSSSPSRKSFSSIPLTESLREKWAVMAGWGKKSAPVVDATEDSVGTSSEVSFNVPKPPEHKARSTLPALNNPLLPVESPTIPTAGQTEATIQPSIQFNNTQLPDRTREQQHTNLHQSSPLKMEYAASTASESPDEYDSDSSEDSSSSDTSEDLGSELKDDLRSLPDMKRRRPISKPPPVWRSASSTTGSQTLAPSDSASQGPYRSVPASSSYPQTNKDWCKALICAWSDKGVWEPLRDEECAVLVSPGLIEAFPLSYMDAQHDAGSSPLVAFELTPIVPLRKGTALDITIRSPPTANSKIKTTNNVMFRSRSLLDCEKLYHMINWARCNNPTYMELERARPKPQPVVTFAAQQPERPRSWFSFGGPQRKNSYRAGSTPPSVAESAATTGSASNALSALKRFSKSSAFSINRSSVIRRPGRATNQSLFSADTNTGSGSGSDFPAPPTQVGFIPGRDGPNVPETSAQAVAGGGMVNNMKIKLFLRQGQDWKPLGTCRLSVLPAPATNTPDASRPGSAGGLTENAVDVETAQRYSSLPATPRREYRLPSSSHTPHRVHGNGREKRLLITQKDRADIILLDEILGESCFEKVAERGIAVKVWTEEEMMRNQGGVLTGRGRLYMMQFGVQSEASWVFGLCGTYRYGMSNEY